MVRSALGQAGRGDSFVGSTPGIIGLCRKKRVGHLFQYDSRNVGLIFEYLTVLVRFWPNSALHTELGAFNGTWRTLLQNCVCRISTGCLSHFVQSCCVCVPHTSLPYYAMSLMIDLNILSQVFIGRAVFIGLLMI